jgi:hypothetical protein
MKFFFLTFITPYLCALGSTITAISSPLSPVLYVS